VTARAGKYARFEYERRLLLREIPADAAADEGWEIVDRYIVGTHLRLRRMERRSSGDVVLKLGQKEAPEAPDFSRLTITNMYLSQGEYDVLLSLPANELRKTRRQVRHEALTYCVDAFCDRLEGLVLAEVSFETAAELDAFAVPSFAVRDVSSDSRFTGGALACTTAAEAASLLAEAVG